MKIRKSENGKCEKESVGFCPKKEKKEKKGGNGIRFLHNEKKNINFLLKTG